MKAVAITAVVCVTVLALAALYAFEVRADGDDDRAAALAAANQIACSGNPPCNDVRDLHRVAPGVWQFRVVPDGRCITVTLEDFRISDDGDRIDGAARSRCDS